MRGYRIAVFMVFVAGLFLLNGCSTVPKMPIKLDPNFASKNIDTVVLMPVVDRRIDKKGSIDLEKDIRIPAKKILEKKGYIVIMPSSFGEGITASMGDVGEMNTQELSDLGPKDARALIFIYVEDIIDEYIVMAYTFKIEATGSLIEKQEKAELWRDKGIGAEGQGGLISGVTSVFNKSAAISRCLSDIFVTLPNCPAKQPAEGAVSSGAKQGEIGPEAPAVSVTPSTPVAR